MLNENKNVIRVDWHLTNRCNFRCEYCHPQIKRVLDTGPSEPSISKIVTAFDNLSDECDILMSGGEPFAFPMFAELCKELSVKHKIRINTNLTFSEEIILQLFTLVNESV
jgi:organic radical activating enzyme